MSIRITYYITDQQRNAVRHVPCRHGQEKPRIKDLGVSREILTRAAHTDITIRTQEEWRKMFCPNVYIDWWCTTGKKKKKWREICWCMNQGVDWVNGFCWSCLSGTRPPETSLKSEYTRRNERSGSFCSHLVRAEDTRSPPGLDTWQGPIRTLQVGFVLHSFRQLQHRHFFYVFSQAAVIVSGEEEVVRDSSSRGRPLKKVHPLESDCCLFPSKMAHPKNYICKCLLIRTTLQSS